jgi:N6-L-threonylcarbamoyladenine synthase
VVVAGGVACNSGLRRSMAEFAAAHGVELSIPSPLLCSDNAAMIAVPGEFYLNAGFRSGFDLDALPVWPLDRLAVRLKEVA